MKLLICLVCIFLINSNNAQLCPNMESGGNSWFCCPCGGSYTQCTWNGAPSDVCWVTPGVNPPGCTLPSDATQWLCCTDCDATCSEICQYNAPMTSSSSTTGTNGHSNGFCLGGSNCNCVLGNIGSLCTLTFIAILIIALGVMASIIACIVLLNRRHNYIRIN